MLSFREAYIYVNNTSSHDIFIRVVPYQVLSGLGYKDHKHIKKTILSILVAALCGPFKFDNLDDPKIKELLSMTDYGHHDKWGPRIDEWGQKYCHTSQDFNYFVEMAQIIIQKQDAVADLLNHEMRYSKMNEHYLPELRPFGFNYDYWPRI
jgi:hypothetical protein